VVLQTPTTSSDSSSLQSIDRLIGQVSQFVYGESDPNDPDLRANAESALDQAADYMNGEGCFVTGRTKYTFATSGGDATLSDNQSEFTLPSDWAFPSNPIRLLNSDGDLIQAAEWKDWRTFQGHVTDADHAAVPYWFSILDTTDSVAHCYPLVDTSEVDKVEFTYLIRVVRVSEVTSLTCINEVQHALLAGGKYFLMEFRYKAQPAVWEPFRKVFNRAIVRAKTAARRTEGPIIPTIYPDEVGGYINIDGAPVPTPRFTSRIKL